MKILFSYIAQPHQILHSFPLAAEIAVSFPNVEVHIACSTDAQERLIADLAAQYPEARFTFHRFVIPLVAKLQLALGIGSVPFKQATLLRNRSLLKRFDAMVVPERTSLFVKRWLALPKLKLIWTRHGAGDRSIGFAPDVKLFDFVLMAGRKIEQRLLENGLIRKSSYFVGCYAKFDAMRKLQPLRPKLFNNGRPTVLYNPHFSGALSSWPADGKRVLDYFAASTQYNLIFAPHIRLFESASAAEREVLERYSSLPHIHVDLGSERSVDMTYTLAADVYLGDVSSQLAEFLWKPRPCLFLNSHRVDWATSPNYAHWQCGTVIGNINELCLTLSQTLRRPDEKLAAQRRYFQETFNLPEGRPSVGPAAAAIVDYLRRVAPSTPKSAATALPAIGSAVAP